MRERQTNWGKLRAKELNLILFTVAVRNNFGVGVYAAVEFAMKSCWLAAEVSSEVDFALCLFLAVEETVIIEITHQLHVRW
jgi:hypothetical protein